MEVSLTEVGEIHMVVQTNETELVKRSHLVEHFNNQAVGEAKIQASPIRKLNKFFLKAKQGN